MEVAVGALTRSPQLCEGEVILLPPSDRSSPPPPSTSWPAPTGVAPPAALGQQPTPSGLIVAFVAVAIGWLIVGFELFMVFVFVGREESCRANRGDAYQSCVRQEDVTELVAEGVAIGLSVIALLIVVRSLHRPLEHAPRRALWIAAVAAVLLAIICVGLWIDGSRGGWAPSRPLPYDPVPTAWGHVAMVIGVLVGSLVGVLVPLARRRSDTARDDPTVRLVDT